MNDIEKMKAGKLYNPSIPEIMDIQLTYIEKLCEFNATRPSQMKIRERLLKELFGSIGEDSYIEPPLHANWGGKHVFIGHSFYANFNLTLVDDGCIYIGNNVMIAPNVTIATASHPVLAELRVKNLQYNVDVHIGDNVWIGAGAIILPGVTVGNDTVIGAGSVVTKDIPSGVVAYGNPCRVARKVDEHDRKFYYKDRPISQEDLK